VGDDASRGAVVVTGSSTGIGRACVLELDRLGFMVFAGVRKAEDGDALRAVASDRLEPLILDITDAGDIAAAVDRVAEVDPGGLSGLVNNAGVGVGGPLELIPIDDFRRQVEINLIGQIAVTQAFLPALRKARGRVVFLSSIGGLVANPYMSPYHASKFGIEAVGDALRQELRPFGVEVSIVEPGSVATPIWEKGKGTAEAIRGRLTSEQEALYGEKVARMAEVVEEVGARGVAPEKIASVIAKALTAGRPRTRYLVGADARAMVLLRRLLPDRLGDRIVARVTGL
jgi:NAD(P)-dependent dehydrogenase (short-subunit alcohol dehydrogenase family)